MLQRPVSGTKRPRSSALTQLRSGSQNSRKVVSERVAKVTTSTRWRSICHGKKPGDFLRTAAPRRDDGDEEHGRLDHPRTKLKRHIRRYFPLLGKDKVTKSILTTVKSFALGVGPEMFASKLQRSA